jgi:hypothetical protein
VIQVEAETQEANDSMIVAVNWLNRISIHFDEFCKRADPDSSFSSRRFNDPVLVRVARFFMTQYTKTGGKLPNYHKITKGP